MKIEEVCPEVIGGLGSLKDSLLQSLLSLGVAADEACGIVAEIPAPLIESGAFLDKMTGLWRYEFGLPFNIGTSQVWGAHMWVPVVHLAKAATTALARLDNAVRAAYLGRLNDAGNHYEALAEMIPATKLAAEVDADFEVAGHGVGETTVDWAIHHERLVLLDVKSRSKDFIEQLENEVTGDTMPEPKHDSALLFRSVAKKFNAADPSAVLQGVWVTTHIAQHEGKLNDAFATLDATKVHFAVFGDWEDDIHVLVRREEDRAFLMRLFNARPSTRFTFTP